MRLPTRAKCENISNYMQANIVTICQCILPASMRRQYISLVYFIWRQYISVQSFIWRQEHLLSKSYLEIEKIHVVIVDLHEFYSLKGRVMFEGCNPEVQTLLQTHIYGWPRSAIASVATMANKFENSSRNIFPV